MTDLLIKTLKKHTNKFLILIVLPLLTVTFCITSFSPKKSGKPWNNKPQTIPGKIQCEFYDLGGEGVAYHDEDSINNGSGKLNPADGSYLKEFRMKEGVDISYTKSNNIDNNAYNMVMPDMDQLYVGWTKPSEWINYTVDVQTTGKYAVGIKYTSNGEGGILLTIDGEDLSEIIKIPTTHNDNDSVQWRQWHHWNYIHSLAEVNLKKGTHALTLHTKVKGDMNFDFLEFTLLK